MNAHAEVQQEKVTLADLARLALNAHDGRTDDAIDALVTKLLSDRSLLRSVIRAAIQDSVSYRVELSMRSDRSTLINRVKRDIAARSTAAATAPSKNTVVTLANGLRKSLLDFTLANGVKLRDATRDQVEDAAARYRLTSTDAIHKAKWLTMIARAVPADKRVGDAISEKKAEEFFARTMENDDAA